VESLSAEQLTAAIGGGNPSVAEIIPQIAQKLPDLAKPLSLEPEQARFQLFDSVAAFLRNAATSNTMLMVLEDLHWADHASLMLLEFVISAVSGSPLMVLGTYRDVELGRRHPLSRTLGELVREANFKRVHLNSFDPDEVSQFVESRASISLDPSDLALVHSRTGGNPLFLNELMRLQAEEGDADAESWKTGLPEGVRDVIGRRLDRLSENCNEALTIASVIGPEFGFNQLQPLLEEVAGTGLLELVEEALSARVIEETPGEPGRYRFAHALIQETLREELPMAGRVRLHARIADTLETQYGTDAENHAAELAYHFSQGALVTGTEKMVHYSRLAGDRALAVHAYDEARALFERALRDTGVPLTGIMPAEDTESASLLSGLGRALAAISDYHDNQKVLDNLARAFDFYEKTGDVNNALAVAEYPQYLMHEYQTAAVLVTRALALVPETSLAAGRLLTSHGQILGLVQGDYDAAQEAFGQALVIARREGDETLELRTLAIGISVDNYHLRWSKTIENIPAVIQMARRANDLYAEVNAHYFGTTALISTGELELARQHAFAMISPAERLRHRFWFAGAFWKNMTAARIVGDWQTARDFGNRGLEISPGDFRLLGDWIVMEYHVGESQDGKAYLENLISHMNSNVPGSTMAYSYPALFAGFVAHITDDRNLAGTAKRAAEIILESPFSNPNVVLRARTGLALVAVHSGDSVSASELHPQIDASTGTMLRFTISADRLLGLLAKTMADLDKAVAHFDDALAFCRKAGYRPELAWTCSDYCDTLLERNGVGDLARAISLLEESLAISSDLGMRPLTERLIARQEQVSAQAGPGPAFPDGLTQREVEVLQLICGGKTDREIGEDLFISIRTVGNHVSNILNKTNSTNRTEAAIYAARHGLTTDPEESDFAD
jgi:DNA-binding CsgD family transcriptional regulator